MLPYDAYNPNYARLNGLLVDIARPSSVTLPGLSDDSLGVTYSDNAPDSLFDYPRLKLMRSD